MTTNNTPDSPQPNPAPTATRAPMRRVMRVSDPKPYVTRAARDSQIKAIDDDDLVWKLLKLGRTRKHVAKVLQRRDPKNRPYTHFEPMVCRFVDVQAAIDLRYLNGAYQLGSIILVLWLLALGASKMYSYSEGQIPGGAALFIEPTAGIGILSNRIGYTHQYQGYALCVLMAAWVGALGLSQGVALPAFTLIYSILGCVLMVRLFPQIDLLGEPRLVSSSKAGSYQSQEDEPGLWIELSDWAWTYNTDHGVPASNEMTPEVAERLLDLAAESSSITSPEDWESAALFFEAENFHGLVGPARERARRAAAQASR